MSSSDIDSTAALVDVTMPQMGVSVVEGTVVEWRKRVGDWVKADETICEISTDKIDTELPSPASGVVTKILAGQDETVEVGAEIAVIDESASEGEKASAATPEGAYVVPPSSHSGVARSS